MSIPWAELLRRVFREEVLRCTCGGHRVVLAYLTEPRTVKAILDHLGLPSTGPPIAPARFDADGAWPDELPASVRWCNVPPGRASTSRSHWLLKTGGDAVNEGT